MGQRLNLEIKNNGHRIANCYYHWGAYTSYAMELAMDFISTFDALCESNPTPLNTKAGSEEALIINSIFTYCKLDEAGLSKKSLEMMQKKYPDYNWKRAVDRNSGLIGIEESEMNDTEMFAEGTVIIDVGSRTVEFGCDFLTELEEFVEDDYYDEELIDLPVLKIDKYNLPFDIFGKYCNFVNRKSRFLVVINDDVFVCDRIE